jgi:hypothetical protein
MKIYDLVKDLLTDYPETRNSDKKLIWKVWEKLGYVETGYALHYEDFLRSPSTESIRRCRQKIQETHTDLQPSFHTRAERRYIQNQKGTFIFRQEVIKQNRLL